MTELTPVTPPTAPKTPDPRFVYHKGNEEKEIFMSFGLVDMICRAVGDPERMFLIGLDFELNQVVLSHLLTIGEDGRPRPKEYDEFVTLKDVPMTDIQDLLTWAAEHATNFFTGVASRAAVRLKDQVETIRPVKEQLVGMINSSAGSQA